MGYYYRKGKKKTLVWVELHDFRKFLINLPLFHNLYVYNEIWILYVLISFADENLMAGVYTGRLFCAYVCVKKIVATWIECVTYVLSTGTQVKRFKQTIA